MQVMLILLLLFHHITSEYNEEENWTRDSQICSRISSPSKDNCLNAQITSNNNYCCLKTIIDSSGESSYCQLFSEETYLYYTDPKTNAFETEETGYSCVKSNSCSYYLSSSTKTECKGNRSFTGIKFDQNDITLFKDDNHCLNIYDKSINGNLKDLNAEVCKNAVLLPSSKQAGISCGYYDFTFTLKDQTTKNFKMCYLMNPDVFQKSENDFQMEIEGLVDEIIEEVYNEDLEDFLSTYVVSFADSNGINKSFDSKTGKLSDQNNSKNLFISKTLFLMVLFLL